ncbi:HAD family hydrolase [Streptomyces sp. PR69]|uniref:HAD family hydrolase n=1 Tax=Streptomyces sp. PR69 TaxID=2984950 RepID=UPI00226551F3|nr:haloacid dehalogenase-like hydrolase [Streptomyces sp. PR69]
MAAHPSDTGPSGGPAAAPASDPGTPNGNPVVGSNGGPSGGPNGGPSGGPSGGPNGGPSGGPSGGPVVGFDLDMTLIDSRPGIHACYRALSAETGVPIDADLAVTRLGPPLEQELAHWFPAERVQAMADRYRELYPAYAIEPALVLPGAREAVAAVQELGGRAVVVTAKHEPNAKLHLAHLGIYPDAVIGWLWAEAKAEALRAHGARVYVGDHTGDVRGARAAEALSVAVPTGPCAADELRAAGADVILADLTRFPAWLRRYASDDGHHRHRADLA